ncbi:hypothetical protein VUR80DRAFT_9052 [Thermomyces stellatus]
MNGQYHSSREGPEPRDEQKQVPRPARSPATISQIRVRNRRREYLRRNPAYLDDLEHELANPVKYETLIRHFQSRAEKDAEAQAKGYSRVLEGDLMRSEAKLAALQASLTGVDGVDGGELTASRQGEGDSSAAPGTDYDDDFEPTTKEEGRELWNEFLTERFVRGKDPDFDYSKVDDDESLDAMERQDEQDAWFDEEEPSWASDDGTDAKMLQGETGIQDF